MAAGCAAAFLFSPPLFPNSCKAASCAAASSCSHSCKAASCKAASLFSHTAAMQLAVLHSHPLAARQLPLRQLRGSWLCCSPPLPHTAARQLAALPYLWKLRGSFVSMRACCFYPA